MTKTTKFKAIILAGGSGERFWPLSTPEMPKQFLSIFGGKSLIRQAVERLAGLVTPKDVFVVTSATLVNLTRKELPEIPAKNIVGEPMRRDTGAAVALGVGVAGVSDDTVLGFFPADQLVTKPAAFRAALRRAIRLADKKVKVSGQGQGRKGSYPIVTLGIKPTCPATGFGYIDPACGTFVEKPDEAKARQYIRKGYLWNAGMFIARAGTFRAAFAKFAPDLLNLSNVSNLSNLAKRYAALPKISFDYAVMEKLSAKGIKNHSLPPPLFSAPSPCVAVVPADCGWDDVGGYLAFDKYFKHDANGNVREGSCQVVDANDNIIVSCWNRISILGVKDLVVVSTPNGVLVAAKTHLRDMKKLLAKE